MQALLRHCCYLSTWDCNSLSFSLKFLPSVSAGISCCVHVCVCVCVLNDVCKYFGLATNTLSTYTLTVGHTKNIKFWFFHILDYKSSTIHCMAMMNTPCKSLFLALQDEAPPVMSFCIIAEI